MWLLEPRDRRRRGAAVDAGADLDRVAPVTGDGGVFAVHDNDVDGMTRWVRAAL